MNFVVGLRSASRHGWGRGVGGVCVEENNPLLQVSTCCNAVKRAVMFYVDSLLSFDKEHYIQ